MIEEQLEKFILSMEFHKLGINVDNIGVYYRESEDSCNILIAYFFPERWGLTQEQQKNIYRQIREKFFAAGRIEQNLMNIAVTEQPQSGRHIFWEGEAYWVVNAVNGQVMLYEDQNSDFCGIRKPLEQWLYQWRLQLLGKSDTANKKIFLGSPVTICLVICNIIIFMAGEWAWLKKGDATLLDFGALNAGEVRRGGEYYRLLTYLFLHGGIEHIVNNMVMLYVIGGKMEKLLGKYRCLFVYFASGILAGIASMSYNTFIDREVNCVGASGAIFGMTGALAAVILIHRGKVEQLTGKQILLFIALSLYGGFTSQGVDNAAHTGGLAAGFILTLLIYHRPVKRKLRACDEG